MQLAGKIALLPDGTRGIGAATAVVPAKEGAAVAIVGRHLDKNDCITGEILTVDEGLTMRIA